MALFSFSITTPITATKTKPKITLIKLSVGVIHYIRVFIPAGQKGLGHTQVLLNKTHIAPTNSAGDFHGDDVEIVYNDFITLAVNNTVLTVLTWNDSTKYEKEVILSFGVLPRFILLPFEIAEKINTGIKKLIGKEYEVKE